MLILFSCHLRVHHRLPGETNQKGQMEFIRGKLTLSREWKLHGLLYHLHLLRHPIDDQIAQTSNRWWLFPRQFDRIFWAFRG